NAIAQTAQPCPPRGVIVVDFIDTAENRKVLAAKRQHFRHERQSIQTAIRVECRGNLGEWSHAYPFARPETKGRRGRLEAQYLTSKAAKEARRSLPAAVGEIWLPGSLQRVAAQRDGAAQRDEPCNRTHSKAQKG